MKPDLAGAEGWETDVVAQKIRSGAGEEVEDESVDPVGSAVEEGRRPAMDRSTISCENEKVGSSTQLSEGRENLP